MSTYDLYMIYSSNLSSAMMVATQKLTSMAFSYYDGVKTEDKLNEDQARYQIKYERYIQVQIILNDEYHS